MTIPFSRRALLAEPPDEAAPGAPLRFSRRQLLETTAPEPLMPGQDWIAAQQASRAALEAPAPAPPSAGMPEIPWGDEGPTFLHPERDEPFPIRTPNAAAALAIMARIRRERAAAEAGDPLAEVARTPDIAPEIEIARQNMPPLLRGLNRAGAASATMLGDLVDALAVTPTQRANAQRLRDAGTEAAAGFPPMASIRDVVRHPGQAPDYIAENLGNALAYLPIAAMGPEVAAPYFITQGMGDVAGTMRQQGVDLSDPRAKALVGPLGVASGLVEGVVEGAMAQRLSPARSLGRVGARTALEMLKGAGQEGLEEVTQQNLGLVGAELAGAPVAPRDVLSQSIEAGAAGAAGGGPLAGATTLVGEARGYLAAQSADRVARARAGTTLKDQPRIQTPTGEKVVTPEGPATAPAAPPTQAAPVNPRSSLPDLAATRLPEKLPEEMTPAERELSDAVGQAQRLASQQAQLGPLVDAGAEEEAVRQRITQAQAALAAMTQAAQAPTAPSPPPVPGPGSAAAYRQQDPTAIPQETRARELAGPGGEPSRRLASGETTRTASGRVTTPFPKVDIGTDRKAQATLKRVNAWLLENAIAEADARGDAFNGDMFRQEQQGMGKRGSLPPAAIDALNEYLFGEQPPVQSSPLRPFPAPPAPRGAATEVLFPDNQTRLPVTYDVVEAEDLIPSHRPDTFAPDPRYPAGVQGRVYHGPEGRIERERVVEARGRFVSEPLLDATQRPGDGPPIVTPEGLVVAGNNRAMILAGLSDQQAEGYRQALLARAGAFGVDPGRVSAMRRPVLIRRTAALDVPTMTRLNQLSDIGTGKAKSAIAQGGSRAAALPERSRALAHLGETLDDDATLGDYLASKDGAALAEELANDGVLARQELGGMLDPQTGRLSPEGVQQVRRILQTAAIGGTDVVAEANAVAREHLNRMDWSLAAVMSVAHSATYRLAPVLRDAYQQIIAARKNGLSVADQVQQGDLLRTVTPAQETAGLVAMAIDQLNRQELTQAMRAYARLAREAEAQGESADMFGATPPDRLTLLAQTIKAALDGKSAPTIVEEIKAWHGSPHKFDAFSTEHIGSGEGAQVYGWGLYFTSKKAIAEHYRKRLTREREGKRWVGPDGLPHGATDLYLLQHYFTPGRLVPGYGGTDRVIEFHLDPSGSGWFTVVQRVIPTDEGQRRIEELAANEAASRPTGSSSLSLEDWHKALKEVAKDPTLWQVRPNDQPRYHSTMPSEEHIERVLGWPESPERPGGTYRVTLAPDDDELLDWDEKLDNQPAKVQDALARAGLYYTEAEARSLKDQADQAYEAYVDARETTGDVKRRAVDYMREANDPSPTTEMLKAITAASRAEDAAYRRSINAQHASDKAEDSRKLDGESLYHKVVGQEVRRGASRRGDAAQRASEALRELGIRGIRYRDGTTRGRSDVAPAYNYVIFDDRDVRIDRVEERKRYDAANPTQAQARQQFLALLDGMGREDVEALLFLWEQSSNASGEITLDDDDRIRSDIGDSDRQRGVGRGRAALLRNAERDLVRWLARATFSPVTDREEWALVSQARALLALPEPLGDLGPHGRPAAAPAVPGTAGPDPAAGQPAAAAAGPVPDAGGESVHAALQAQLDGTAPIQSARPALYDRLPGLATGIPIARDVLARLVRTGRAIAVLGAQVQNARDLAAVAQAFRHPLYETVRYYIVHPRTHAIVWAEALTTRELSSAPALPDGHTHASFAERLKRMADAHRDPQFGQAIIYIQHNHPSGDPTPSPEDYAFVRELDRALRDIGHDGIRASIVIDHGTYAHWAGTTTGPAAIDAVPGIDPTSPDPLRTRDGVAPIVGYPVTSPKDLAKVGSAFLHDQGGGDVLIYMDTKSRIVGVQANAEAPFYNSETRIKRAKRLLAAQWAVLVTASQSVYNAVRHNPSALVTDVIHVESTTGTRSHRSALNTMSMSNTPGARLRNLPDSRWTEQMKQGALARSRRMAETTLFGEEESPADARGQTDLGLGDTPARGPQGMTEALARAARIVADPKEAFLAKQGRPSRAYTEARALLDRQQAISPTEMQARGEELRGEDASPARDLPDQGMLFDRREGYAGEEPDSPAFRRWFGDSKVVDATGKPLVVYHGTQHGDFDVFSRTPSGAYATQRTSINAIGSWFTDSERNARMYAAADVAGGAPPGSRVMAAYLSIKKPMRIQSRDGLLAMWQKFGAGHPRGHSGNPEALRAALMAAGYDGLIMEAQAIDGTLADEGSFYYVVLSPEQIKSATGNRGTFDPEDASILREPQRLYGLSAMRETATQDPGSPAHEGSAFGRALRRLLRLPPPDPKVKPLIRIAKELAKATGATVRQKRSGQHRGDNVGYFRPDTEGIRVGRYDWLDTVAHEIGHFISQQYLGKPTQLKPYYVPAGVTRLRFTAAMKRELVQMGKDLYGSRKPASGYGEEGIAEWFSFYVTEPQTLTTKAPTVTPFLLQVLAQHPTLKQGLDQAREDFRIHQAAGPDARVDAMISVNETQRRPISVEALVHDWLNRLNEYRDAVQDLDGFQRDPRGNPYLLARATQRANGVAMHLIATRVQPVLQAVGEGRLQRFRRYLEAETALEGWQRPTPVNSGITRADAEAIVTRDRPEFEALAKPLWQLSLDLLKMRRDAGLLTKESHDQIAAVNQRRVGFYVVFDPEETAGGAGRGSRPMPKNSSGLQRKGDTARVKIDPLEAILSDTFRAVRDAANHRAATALIKLALRTQGGGHVIEEVPTPQVRSSVQMHHILRQLEDLGLQLGGTDAKTGKHEAIPHAAIMQTLGGFHFKGFMDAMVAGGKEGKDLVFPAIINGQRRWFQVRDRQLFEAMQGIDPTKSDRIIQVLNNPDANVASKLFLGSFVLAKKIKQAGATLNLDFMARNPVKDAFAAAVFSRSGWTVPGQHFAEGLFALAHHLRGGQGTDHYGEWLAQGGEMQTQLGVDRRTDQRRIAEMVAATPGQKTWQVVRHPLDALAVMSGFMESMTRVGEYARLRRQGASRIEGMEGASEITQNFAQQGAQAAAINQIVPFFTAHLGGWEKLYREFRERPRETGLRLFVYLTLPSLALAWLHRDDEEWKKTAGWLKASAWLLWVQRDAEGNVVRRWFLPKPPGIGQVFGSIPERVMEYLLEHDPHQAELLGQTAVDALMPPGWPALFQPAWEIGTNHDTFRDRPLVPRSRENLIPADQTSAYTGETARVLGGAMGASPAKVEHALTGYGAGLARFGLSASDAAIRALRASQGLPELRPERPSRGDPLVELPAIRGFVRGPEGESAEDVELFYRRWKDAESKRQSWRKRLQEGRTEEAAALFAQEREAILSVATAEEGGPGWLRVLHEQMTEAANARRTPQLSAASRERLSAYMTTLARQAHRTPAEVP